MRIVFEGLPGAGKTSVVQDIAAAFALPVIPEWTCFTDRAWREFELTTPFYFANDEVKEFIGRLFAGHVLFDRHYTGALAYGYALTEVRGADPSTGECYQTNLAWYQEGLDQQRLTQPDHVFVLDIAAETSLLRQPRARGFDPVFGEPDCSLTW